MPSFFSRVLRSQIRFIRPILASFNEKSGRKVQNRLGMLGERIFGKWVEYLPAVDYDATTAMWAIPIAKKPQRTIFYLHGGGYVSGSLEYSKLFGSVLCKECESSVFCLGYSLAPEKPYPAALGDAFDAYRYLLESGISPESLAVAGESAGGGLLFCLMHKLKDEGIPLPGCLVAISPWADLTFSSETIDMNKRTDAALTKKQLEYYVKCYAPGEAAHRYVSPIYGSFDGFPPALVIASDDELLTGDAIALKRCYDDANGECEMILEKKMWHAYPLYRTPESSAALERIKKFVKEHTNHD